MNAHTRGVGSIRRIATVAAVAPGATVTTGYTQRRLCNSNRSSSLRRNRWFTAAGPLVPSVVRLASIPARTQALVRRPAYEFQ